jgi:hypothetical protein
MDICSSRSDRFRSRAKELMASWCVCTAEGVPLPPDVLVYWRHVMEALSSILLFEFTEAPPRCPEPLRVALQAYLAGELDRAALQAACTAALGAWTDRAPAYLFRLSDQWRARAQFDELDHRILDCAVAVGPSQLAMLLSFFNTAHYGAIRDYLLAAYGEPKEAALRLFLEVYRWKEAAIGYGPAVWSQTLLTLLPVQGTLLLALIEQQAWPIEQVLHLVKLLARAGPSARDLIPPLAERLWAAGVQIAENDLPLFVRIAPERFAEQAIRFLSPLSLAWPRSEHQAALLQALMDIDPARYIEYAVQAAQLDLTDTKHYYSMPSLPGVGVTRAFQFAPARYLPLVEALLTSPRETFRRFGLDLLREHDWEGKQAYFLALLGHRRAEVRANAAEWLAQQGEPCIPILAQVLSHPDARVRLHAASALEQIGTPGALDVLRQRLPVERAPAVRQKLTALVGQPTVTDPASTASAEQIAALCAVAEAEPHTGRAFTWLDPVALPDLRWCTGTPVPLAVIRYLLQCQAGMSAMALAPVVEGVVGLIDQASAGDFALALVHSWAESRAPLSDMRVLLLAAALGDDRIIAHLCARDDQRSEQVKFEVACNEAWIFAQLGTDAALRAIGARCLFPARNILWTALDALAARRQTTPEDLFDVCTPDLGFSTQGEQVIAYSQRRLIARVSPVWSGDSYIFIRLFDEQGAHLREFPSWRSSDDRREYRQAIRAWWHLRSKVRDSIEALLYHLDAAITSRRSWPVERWRQLFLEHPLQRLAASLLIWEYQAAPEAPWTRCTVTAAGECTTFAGAPLDLEQTGALRLAHPAELEAAALERCRATAPYLLKHLWEHEQLGLQGWRPFTPRPAEERAARWHDLAHPFACEYDDLRKRGWLPGSETNDEPFTTLWKPLPSAGVTVVAQTRTPTCLQLRSFGHPVCRGELARLGFVPFDVVERGSSAYRDLLLDNAQLLPLEAVPARAFSDALYDVQRFRKLQV